MQIIPSEKFTSRDEASLVAFLKHCQDAARQYEFPHIASIAIETGFIDPLAIMESIRDDGTPLWYVERPTDEFALSCGESVAYEEFSGPHRFSKARTFVDDVFSRTIATGDLASGGAGPTFAVAATFEENGEKNHQHPAALSVFMPRWQVLRKGPRHYAVANAVVEEKSNLELIAHSIWKAHTKLSNFRTENASSNHQPSSPPKLKPRQERNDYEEIVTKAIELLDAETFSKIVLARKIILDSDRSLNPFALAHQLRERFPECHTFCLGDKRSGILVGATPENLLRTNGDRVETEALAGTRARGRNAGSDAQLGQALLDDEKEGREHRLVVESILRRMRSIGLEGCEEGRPRLLRLPNLQHMRTPLRAKLPGNLHPFEILGELHPTPAMGGSPRELALPYLRDIEGFPRGWYTGVAGWFDHEGEGEFVVPIRCGFINGKQVELYAGAGIVKGSNPANEKMETDLKLSAMLESIQRT